MKIILLTFVLYLLIILGVAQYARMVTKNLSDYILGGRSLNGWLVALGAGASDMSSWLLLALPGAVYLNGLSEIWLPIGLLAGSFFNWQFVSQRLRIYSEKVGNALTIPSYLHYRFQDKQRLLRTVTAIVIIIFFTAYLGAGLTAIDDLFRSAFHIQHHIGGMIGVAIILIYTLTGGFLALTWLDFFQGTLMFFALVITPVTAIFMQHGWPSTLHSITMASPHAMYIFHHTSALFALSLIAWGFGYMGQPHILVRFMASKNASALVKAKWVCTVWMSVALIGALLTGLVAIGFFSKTPLTDPETAFLAFAHTLFPSWLTGILLAAVLSASMSTSSAQLLAAASAIAEDLYHPYLRPTAGQKELLYISRISVAIISLFASLLVLFYHQFIFDLVSYAWSGLGASFGPTLLLSLYWEKMTKKGAFAGMITGTLIVLIWPELQHHGYFTDCYSLIPGFLLSFLIIIIVSLFDTSPNESIRKEFRRIKLDF